VAAHVRKADVGRNMTSFTVLGTDTALATFAMTQAANALLCEGVVPGRVAFSLSVPTETDEATIRAWVLALKHGMEQYKEPMVLSDQTIQRAIVAAPILTVTVSGDKKIVRETAKDGKPCMLIQCGEMAKVATYEMFQTEEKLQRFPEHFRKPTYELLEQLSLDEAIRTGYANGALAMQTYHTGGIFSGLWELGEHFRLGMELNLPDMLLSQQTIEGCEVLDVNPYLLGGGGSVLMITQEPERLLAALWDEGLAAEQIGTLHTGKSRIVRNGEEVRNL